MSASAKAAEGRLIGRVTAALADLGEADLALVADFVDLLRGHRDDDRLSPGQIRTEARRRSRLLADTPREQLVARFFELGREIRREAMARGKAVEGDWMGD